jgi:hypothetical protein
MPAAAELLQNSTLPFLDMQPSQKDMIPTLGDIIAQELQKERVNLLSGFDQLLIQHLAVSSAEALKQGVPNKWCNPEAIPARVQSAESFAVLDYPEILEEDPEAAQVATKLSIASNNLLGEVERDKRQPSHAAGQGLSEIDAHRKKMSPDLDWNSLQRSASSMQAGVSDLAMRAMSSKAELEEAFAREIIDTESVASVENKLAKIVNSHYFEFSCGLLILLNVLFLALEMQYSGFETGYILGAKTFSEPAKDIWPSFDSFFEVCEVLFNTWFVIELLLRIGAAGIRAINSRWIWLDAILVGLSLAEVGGAAFGVNPSMMRMIRFLRIMRMFRLAKDIGAFQALVFFLKAIEESVGALVWTFVVLFSIQLAVGMCLHQVLSMWLNDDSVDTEKRREIFVYFGTFSRTMVTMFEITIANWVPTCRLLSSVVSEWFALFYIVYRCMFMFGAVKVITAVFIAQTNRALARDDDLVVMVQEQERLLFRKKLEDMFEGLDTSRDGYLSWSEFEAITQNKLWRSWGDKLGLPMSDLVSLFELLAGNDGRVSAKEFFHGIQRLKGAAKSVDVVWLLSEVGKMIEDKLEYGKMTGMMKTLIAQGADRQQQEPVSCNGIDIHFAEPKLETDLDIANRVAI